MNEDFMFDADFNNFYDEFVGKNRKNKEKSAPPMLPNPTTPTKSGQVTCGVPPLLPCPPQAPAKAPEKKKGGFFSGLGGFLQSETGQAVLGGVSRGIENRQGLGGGNQGGGGGGGFEDAPNQNQGLSTGAMIGIAVGGLAVVGLAIYLVTKK
jgi:hypothetical protein